MLQSTTAASPQLAKIAREIALLRAEQGLEIRELSHIPGKSNVLADSLSRLYDPEPSVLPAVFQTLPRDSAPLRDASFWLVDDPAGGANRSRRKAAREGPKRPKTAGPNGQSREHR